MKSFLKESALILFLVLNLNCTQKDKFEIKDVKGGNISKQCYDNESSNLSFEDEETVLLKNNPNYKEIFYDYGNYWENILDPNNFILFDLNSQKMIVFKDFKTLDSSYNNNKVFVFNIENSNPIKIVGLFGFKDGDTIMNWTFDEKNKSLINESGFVFKQIKAK